MNPFKHPKLVHRCSSLAILQAKRGYVNPDGSEIISERGAVKVARGLNPPTPSTRTLAITVFSYYVAAKQYMVYKQSTAIVTTLMTKKQYFAGGVR